MTCNEFRRLNVTDAALFIMTRGERAACAGHYQACAACRAFIADQPPDDPSMDVTLRIAMVAEQIAADFADPEVGT